MIKVLEKNSKRMIPVICSLFFHTGFFFSSPNSNMPIIRVKGIQRKERILER
jgi:hypothetical protein